MLSFSFIFCFLLQYEKNLLDSRALCFFLYSLNTIINFYFSFNNLFFNYYVSDLKVIILIINYSIKIYFIFKIYKLILNIILLYL
jgi:hypothetical protein